MRSYKSASPNKNLLNAYPGVLVESYNYGDKDNSGHTKIGLVPKLGRGVRLCGLDNWLYDRDLCF